MKTKFILIIAISIMALGFTPILTNTDSSTVYVCGKSTISIPHTHSPTPLLSFRATSVPLRSLRYLE